MAKIIELALVLLIALVVSLEVVTGLRCHSCSYMKYGNETRGCSFCKKPGECRKLLETCTGDKNDVLGCGKLAVVNGTGLDVNSTTIGYGVYRGCTSMTHSPKIILQGCKEKTVAEWDEGKDEWSQLVATYGKLFYTSDTKVEACYCDDKDKCNAAPGLTVSISVLGLVVSLSATAGFLRF